MVVSTLLTILVPAIISFLLHFWQLTAYLPAVTTSSVSLASSRFNPLNNTIKSVEKGAYDSKEPTTHATAVIGDTFRDPLLDTSGPSLNILAKLQNIVSSTLLPFNTRFGLNLFQQSTKLVPLVRFSPVIIKRISPITRGAIYVSFQSLINSIRVLLKYLRTIL
jgi:hypothetical protein